MTWIYNSFQNFNELIFWYLFNILASEELRFPNQICSLKVDIRSKYKLKLITYLMYKDT